MAKPGRLDLTQCTKHHHSTHVLCIIAPSSMTVHSCSCVRPCTVAPLRTIRCSKPRQSVAGALAQAQPLPAQTMLAPFRFFSLLPIETMVPPTIRQQLFEQFEHHLRCCQCLPTLLQKPAPALSD